MRNRILSLFLIAVSPALADAHALGIDCTLKGDKVHVEAFYDDDSAAAKAKVQVVNAKDEIIANGVTDAKGLWSFPAPAPGKYEVRVDAGAGHRAKKSITIPGAKFDGDTPLPDQSVSEGSRAEFVAFPWLKVTVGLVVIVGLASGCLVASLIRKNGSAT